MFNMSGVLKIYNSTWSFLLVLWFGVCVEVDKDIITILPPLPPSLHIFSYPQFFL